MKRSFRSPSQLVLIASFLLLLVAAVYWVVRVTPQPPGSSSVQNADVGKVAQDSEQRNVSPNLNTGQNTGSARLESSSTKTKHRQRPPEPLEASPRARELMAQITQIDVSKGSITLEQAEQWKQALGELASQGAAAVPAIREFLLKNEDLDFRIVRGGILVGQLSIRTALINTLQQIGGPEAQDLMVQTLAATAIPSEVALLANYLDQQAPGQFRQQALNSAEAVLDMAAQGQLSGWDIGTLLQMIRDFDATKLGPTVEKLQAQYKFYGPIALAGLENGAGLQTILRTLQDPAEGARPEFAYQMLAQIGAQSPDAGAALVQLARQGRVPESAWPKIALGLGGDQYGMFNFSPDGKPDVPSVPGVKTYHVESGDQNFYSLPITAISPEQVSLRQSLIDQLLATKPPPDAAQALRQAKAALVAQK